MRKTLFIIAVATGLACAGAAQEINIASISKNHANMDGDTVELTVINRGWGGSDKPVYGTMLSRSDWTAEDETGACFVHGWGKGFSAGEKVNDTVVIKVIVHSQDTTFWLELVE